MPRLDGRRPDELRPTAITRRYTRTAPGSVLVETGGTRVLCTASVQEAVPEFLVGKGKGWLTAEYSMLPGSTAPRKARDRGGKPDGRGVEIQRLIGRCLRSVVDLKALGERTVWIDCDVLDADGGTRTASITGAFVAAVDALGPRAADVVRDSIAAVSVGIVAGEALLDLPYAEDSRADVDMNVVMTGRGSFVEVQGAAEGATFSRAELDRLLELAALGCERLRAAQAAALADVWAPPA